MAALPNCFTKVSRRGGMRRIHGILIVSARISYALYTAATYSDAVI